MQDRDFQATILGIESPWHVTEVLVSKNPKRIETLVEYQGPATCPTCGATAPAHDHRERRWRHLDIYEYAAFVVVRVPCVDCSQHGVQQLRVPFAEGRSGFTALFERLAISMLREMSISTVARIMHLSWDELNGIMKRAIDRGLALRAERIVKHIGIDEKSFKKRHKYVTIVSDLDVGQVIWVGRGRKRETLDGFWKRLSTEQLEGIQGIAMDMWPAYIESTLDAVPAAARKIVFDKFHIVKYLTHAVDLERRVAARTDPTLKKTRYSWLRNPANMAHSERMAFSNLRKGHERLSRAWAIKESFADFWTYRYVGATRRFFKRWYGWAVRSRFKHIKAVAQLIERHLENILTYLDPDHQCGQRKHQQQDPVDQISGTWIQKRGAVRAGNFLSLRWLRLDPTHTNS